jgi:hypothetical protein
MTYVVDPEELFNIEEDLDWMKAGLDLVDNGFEILMLRRKPM